MVVAEAVARGLPVVATTGGGLPDTLGHAPDGTRPGLLVPPDDPAALAAALRRWFAEPALRDRLRGAAIARAATLPGWTETAEAVAAALVPAVPAPRRASSAIALGGAPTTRSAPGSDPPGPSGDGGVVPQPRASREAVRPSPVRGAAP